MKADALISEIGGVREKFGRHLIRLNIKTVRDLLFHFPFRYDDFSRVVPAAELKIGEVATVSGIVKRVRSTRSWKRRMTITEAVIADASGGVRSRLVQPAVCRQNPEARPADQSVRKINPGQKRRLLFRPRLRNRRRKRAGEAHRGTGADLSGNPRAHFAGNPLSYQRVFKQNRETSRRHPRKRPPKRRPAGNKRSPAANSFSQNARRSRGGEKRFAFEDLFMMQLAGLSEKLKLSRCRAYPVEIAAAAFKARLDALPFELTASQKNRLRKY